jgi:hypothetical protein
VKPSKVKTRLQAFALSNGQLVWLRHGTLKTGEDGRALQNVLICVEMIVAGAGTS